MSGRKLVVVIVLLASAGAIGATWYRRASRPALAQDLADPERRARAFLKLLRANNLWGLAQDHFHDGRETSPGDAYIFARGQDGSRWHVVRAVNTSETAKSGKARAAAVVFSEGGTIAAVIEGGIPALLSGSPLEGVAAIVAPALDVPGASSVLFVGKELIEGLRVVGDFALETARGSRVQIGDAPPENGPLFRYEAASEKLRGPEGGPDKPWRVDRGRSPRYVP